MEQEFPVDFVGGLLMSKYAPLYDYLLALRWSKISITFSELEQVLRFALPNSAYVHRAWWANNGQRHCHAQAWLDAGYKIENVDLRAKTVSFLESGLPGTSGSAET